MANSAQAKKRARQAEKRREHNSSIRGSMRTAVKKVITALDAGDKATAATEFKVAIPALDKMARKGIIHPNKAARHKSRLNARIQAA